MSNAVAKKVAADMGAASWIRDMFEKGRRLKAELGEENVYDLSLGNPQAAPPEAFFDALQAVAAQRRPALHGYMANAGFDDTRVAINNLAIRPNQERRRDGADTVAVRERTLVRFLGPDLRPSHLFVSGKLAGGVRVAVEADAHHDKTVRGMPLMELLDVWQLGHARSAPRRPEIQQDDLAAQLGELERLSVERSGLEVGCEHACVNAPYLHAVDVLFLSFLADRQDDLLFPGDIAWQRPSGGGRGLRVA